VRAPYNKPFFPPPSCLFAGLSPGRPGGSKKRKIRPSDPNETPNEGNPSSTPASTPPLEAAPFESLLEDYSNQLVELSQPEANKPTRTFTENVATSAAWGQLLPKLVYPLMAQQQSRKERNPCPSDSPTTPQCACSQREANVLVVSFTSKYCPLDIMSTTPRPSVLAITPVTIQYCECTHPAIALVRQGAFTSTPVNPPKWAFDLQYLAFIREQFLAGIPNFSAWCNGVVAFLTKDGCQQVPSAVSDGTTKASILCYQPPLQSALARPLSSSLRHYQLVLDRISTLVERVIWSFHSSTTKGQEQPVYEAPPLSHSAPPSMSPLSLACAPDSASTSPSVKPEGPTLNLSTEAVREAASQPALTIDSLESPFHQPHADQPSPYLQNLCPLCFHLTLDKLRETLKGLPNAKL